MKKLLAILMAACTVTLLLSACGGTANEGDTTEKTTIRLGGLKGPTTMGMVKLLQDQEDGVTKNDYAFTMAAAADELNPQFLKGELDIIAIPVNVGAILYNKSKGAVQMAAVNMLGAIYIAEKGGDTINEVSALKGKTILATGKGTTPEYVLTYLLKQNGLEIGKDVKMEWKSEPTEVVANMKTMDTAVAMLPEPFLTVAESQVEGLQVQLNLYEEWEKVSTEGQFLTAGLFVRKAFAEEHPEALKTFLEEYEASTKFTKTNIEEAAALIEKQKITKAEIAKKALPNCNIVCITGQEMVDATTGYLQILYEGNPDAVGSKLPEGDFFLNYE